jgi:dTDP-4-dehydrorhamnose 3,5-epimerase/reductase
LDDSEFLITGGGGQLGRALQEKYPRARATDSADLDISDWKAVKDFDWDNVTTILNAAAYTNVDGAETEHGRVGAWKVNAGGLANLVRIALEKNLLIVHISTDYVFDGTKKSHTEDEPFSPLNVYGASKAAGDATLSVWPKHYLLRSSWVIGDGRNFVRSMMELGRKGVNPKVVADQFGRPTFTNELTRAIDHLLKKQPPSGTYNLSNGGDQASWADIARAVYQAAGFSGLTVGDTTAAEYFAGKLAADRPAHSMLDLTKINAAGFSPQDWREALSDYIKKELNNVSH